MTYNIKPEYLHLWGEDATEDTVLTREDVDSITRGWDKTIGDVIDQLIIRDDDGTRWESIASLMDDEIREKVHCDLAPCGPEEFLEEYKRLHLEKFGEEFTY